jgi:hypothetical protein
MIRVDGHANRRSYDAEAYKPAVELNGALERGELSWAITCGAEVARIDLETARHHSGGCPGPDIRTTAGLLGPHDTARRNRGGRHRARLLSGGRNG